MRSNHQRRFCPVASPTKGGDPSRAISYDETPEGHAVRFDGNGELVGLTLVRPKRLLERDGELRITVPVPSAVPAAELTSALTA